MGHIQGYSDLPWSLSVPSLFQTDEIESSNHKRQREHEHDSDQVTPLAKKALAESYILNLSNDILRHIVQNYIDKCSQIVTRFVNKRFHGITSFKSKKFCVLAAREGYLDLIKWSRSPFSRIRPPLKRNIWTQASVGGHVEILKWMGSLVTGSCIPLIKHDYMRSVFAVFAHLGLLGNREAFKWFMEDEYSKLCVENVPLGHLEMLKYLKSLKSNYSIDRVFTLLQKRAEGEPWTEDEKQEVVASSSDYPGVMTWFMEIGVVIFYDYVYDLVEWGRLSLLKTALRLGKLDVTDCLEWAANMGDFKIVKWALANGARLETGYSCESAASGLQIGMLKWLRANGAPWDESVFNFIEFKDPDSPLEEHEKLEVFKWLYKNNAPLPKYLPDGLSWRDIKKISEIEIKFLKWVDENHLPQDYCKGTSPLSFLNLIKLDMDSTSLSEKDESSSVQSTV